MKIKYKLIKNERVEDAPFIGALISAIDCKFNCKNCFNQNLKNAKTQYKQDFEIIKEIKKNYFHKGIILAGLEWTLQINEACALANEAHKCNLQTILFTGNTFEYMKKMHEDRLKCFDYIKCGQFIESLATINHIEYGVKLATSNQHIYKKGVDY